MIQAHAQLVEQMTPLMVAIGGGQAKVGSAPYAEHSWPDERPVQTLDLAPFSMLRTAVPWALFSMFDPGISLDETNPELPATQVLWDHAALFAKFAGGRLPTEAEWEYACRCGRDTVWPTGDDPSGLAETSWYQDNADGVLQPVASKAPNPWGLYDMTGNVWEWCADAYGPPGQPQPKIALRRVLRGGSVASPADALRCARRSHAPGGFRLDDVGFRVVWEASGPQMLGEDNG